MRAVEVDYGYTIDQAGNSHVISYRQKSGFWLGVFVAIALFVPAYFVLDMTVGAIFSIPEAISLVLAVVLSIVCGRALVRFLDARRPRRTISISPEFLEADGKRYERRHITQLYVRGPNEAHNPNPAIANNSGIVAFGASGAFGAGGVAAAGIQAGADGIRNSVGMVSHGVLGVFNIWSRSRGWAIWMNYGAKPKRIANRLEASHAELLVQDLGRLLQGH